ncbi:MULTISPECIES: 3',5'-cyclic-AMP phosphodiesterase [Achromobacter]|uniref:3',5'-cyclic-AMP phosphodiesterase n=1 Tax=Alcaligenes xylosoxydans xylosoxydans TaxID=85698 RepID=A0A424W9C4_ALCXX|nr:MULTISPECIES: 3',5'-cyclic-AMP phosphodiesterase [Achromobacter]MBC9907218.1 3',5'-cyclic-AMP phosphodiesterase [Achromobacter xylosoxidans]MBD0870787.1 3',5'-cyclic-AMP phosphodiesterase [Achromobacter xylosoxidans]QNP86130.1 3',5'-cyclic-AMP phosphodiesterase [Achromobacter xylosoxidans]RPJ89835.1 3',5'-cyclic-AMP phosphodiesterase [Achromobacter xylosoxidans]WLW62013.1 3',5'-cyclic-AMP phosphodiesterase [Achromobacter aegrifaciens]
MARIHSLTRRDDAPAMLVQLTDSHLFGEPETSMLGVNTDASLRAVLRQIEADGKHPDLLLATGDMSQDGEAAAYRRLARVLSEAPALAQACIRCLPGNHDLPAVMRQELPQWSVPVTDVGAWRVVTLDTTVPGSNAGHLPASQLDLLEAALAEAPGRHTLVAMHHNPMQIDSHWHDSMMIDNPQALFKLLARWPQVRVLLWGHVHHEFDRRRHNLRLLATPSTCFQFSIRDGKHVVDNMAPGYRWIKLYQDGSMATGVRRVQDALWHGAMTASDNAQAA